MTFHLASISTAMAADPKKSSRPVVATPTGGGRSFAKFQKAAVASSVSKKTSPPRAATPGRDRPKSPGRSRSRDVVQEVYDRMGVNYKRGQSSFELDDNKSTISIHSGTKSITKSPSRNRVNARYMHNNNQLSPAYPADADARSAKSNISSGVGRRWSSSHSVTSSNNKGGNHPVVVYPSKRDTAPRYSNTTTTPSNREDGCFPTTNTHKQPSLEVDSRDEVAEDREVGEVCGREEMRDDGEERREGPPAEVVEEHESGRTSPLSVKSRISAFSGVTGARKTFNPSTKRTSETSWSVDASDKLGTPVNRYKAAKSSLANSYMAAIKGHKSGNPPVTTPPVIHHKTQSSDFSITSIPVANLPSGCDDDDQSVAASEISVEDFTATISKKEAPRVVSGKSKSDNVSDFNTSKEFIDQMIEEKLQAKFAELQSTMEDQLRRVEEQANERLNDMQKKLDNFMRGTDEQKTSSTPQSPVVQPIHLRSYRR